MNFGPGPQGGFYNALALGQQAGDRVLNAFMQGRQMKEQREERNALAAYATDPNEANLKALAPYQPEFVLKQGQAQQAAVREEQIGKLRVEALGGNEDALTQLAQLSIDDWKAINPEAKDRAAKDSEVLGNAAIQLLNIPYQQRPGQIIAYAQQFPRYADRIQEIAYLPQAQQDEALRAVVVDAKLAAKLIEIERPSYQAVGVDQDLVNVRDPDALRQFDARRNGGGGAQYTEGQTATNPTTGQKIVFRNGAWSPM